MSLSLRGPSAPKAQLGLPLRYTVDGDLFFVSRAKDPIVIGGEKYAPYDVETAINRVPASAKVRGGVRRRERGGGNRGDR